MIYAHNNIWLIRGQSPEKNLGDLEKEDALLFQGLLDLRHTTVKVYKKVRVSRRFLRSLDTINQRNEAAELGLLQTAQRNNDYRRYSNNRNFIGTLKTAILERDQHRCQACGSTASELGELHRLEIDHKIPWRVGGKTVMTNGQVLCTGCNNGRKRYLHWGLPHDPWLKKVLKAWDHSKDEVILD
ncbi:HNH endonuclease [Marinobacter goseongensis]|uniref:HNH endonuclease n=1 Tax=Marinobacter goseongensis TaxID=453838 RepID=UPI00200517B2|nr:HNH endonuclease [Marinobacter goseongensis]